MSQSCPLRIISLGLAAKLMDGGDTASLAKILGNVRIPGDASC